MAAQVLPTPRLLAPSGPAPRTPDEIYWKTFKNQLLLPSPHNASITSITAPDQFSATSQAENFVVTSGSRIQLFNIKTRKLVKTISRFGVDDVARSGVLRRDGRVLLAGGDSGIVQAFDTGSRAILRQWRGEHAHKQAVHVAQWSPSVLTDFMTASDDRTVRLWDLTEEVAKWTGFGHQDYVRAGCFLPSQEGLLVTGGYDQVVRLWDTRQPGTSNASVMAFKHAAPIESVIPLSGSSIAAAAGNEVSILDLVAGKPEHIIKSHQKTVTCLSTADSGRRLLTGGLDGHVKIHNTSAWDVVAGFKHPAPILSLRVIASGSSESREDKHLAVGLQTGLLSLRTRLAGAEKARAREKTKKMDALIAGTADEYERKQRKKDLRQGIKIRDRGKDFRGEGADIVITGNERPKQKKPVAWQQSLRTGKYGLALDQVLIPQTTSNEDVLTLVTALRHRSALRSAMADRTESGLLPVLRWVLKYMGHPRHLHLLYDVMLLFIDLYGHKMAGWRERGEDGREVYSLVKRIGRRVKHGTHLAHQAAMTVGILESLEAG